LSEESPPQAAPAREFPSPAWPQRGGATRHPTAAGSGADFQLSAPPLTPITGLLPLSVDPVSSASGEAGDLTGAPSRQAEAKPQTSKAEGCATAGEAAGITAGSGVPGRGASYTGAQAPASASLDEFPGNLRPLGQVHESFIVATNDQGLWIIDQHVAHERVLFEHHLRARREKRVEGQRLLLPIVVELKPEQQVTFQEIAQELAANGFEAEPFGQRTLAIKTAPSEVRADDAERLLIEILDGAGAESRQLSLDGLLHRIAASVACHAAIKVNMPLTSSKMEWLLRELEKTDCPMTCPHGRPILLRYSMKDILKAFKRI
ncbi:MAG: DNA mismatch repair endonuclease MutL, partial [Terriglobia bacterium]